MTEDLANDEGVVAPLQAADAATGEEVPLIARIHAARLREAGPLPAISEESIQYILSAVHELPVDALKFVAGGTPHAGELWRAGKHEALLVWVRRVFDDGVVDGVPVVLDVELADEESVLIPAAATPLGCELAAMTSVRSHLSGDVFLNFMCALDIGAEVEEVMQATREGRRPVNVLVGSPICDDADRRIEYRCAIRDVLAHLSPSVANASSSTASTKEGS